MVCSICYEAFGDDGEANRPTCLPCGHVFHHHCATRWLKECANRPVDLRGCPMCKKACRVTDLLVLWPSDLDDLDRLLAERNNPDSKWSAQLEGMDQEEATALLDSLVDFTQAAQNYVTAVVGARAVSTRQAGSRMMKLIRSAGTGQEAEDLLTAIDATTQIVDMFRQTIRKLDDRSNSHRRARRAVDKEIETLKQESTRIVKREQQVQHREKILDAREAEVNKARTEVIAEAATWEDKHKRMMEDVNKARKEAALSASNALKARVEAAQSVAAKEHECQSRLGEMQTAVAEAIEHQTRAEESAFETRSKNNMLAEQMREYQKHLKESKEARNEEKTKRRILEKQLQDAQMSLLRLQESQKRSAPVELPPWSRSILPHMPSSASLSSPSSRKRLCTTQDFLGPNSSMSSLSRLDFGGSDGSPETSRSSMSYSRQSGLDLDDMEEDFLPMPGLPPRKFSRVNSSSSTGGNGGASAAATAGPTHYASNSSLVASDSDHKHPHHRSIDVAYSGSSRVPKDDDDDDENDDDDNNVSVRPGPSRTTTFTSRPRRPPPPRQGSPPQLQLPLPLQPRENHQQQAATTTPTSAAAAAAAAAASTSTALQKPKITDPLLQRLKLNAAVGVVVGPKRKVRG